MPQVVDFQNVSTVGLEASDVAQALAGLRANEARYFKNKYDHLFAVSPANEAREALDWVTRILAEERDIVESYDLGVNSYIVKPVDFAQFSQTITQVGLYWSVVNRTPGSV